MYSPGSPHAGYLNGDEIVEEISSSVAGNQPDYKSAISRAWSVNKTIQDKTEAGIPVIDLTKVQGLIEKLEHVRSEQFALKRDGNDELRGRLSIALRNLIASAYSQRELAANLLSQKAASAQAMSTAPENSPQANSLFGRVVSVLQSVGRGNQPKTPPTRGYHHDIPPELMRLVMEDDFQSEVPASGDNTVIGAFSPTAKAPSIDSVVPEFTSPHGPPTNEPRRGVELVLVQGDGAFTAATSEAPSAEVFPTPVAATEGASNAEASPRGPPALNAASPLSSTPPELQQKSSTSTDYGESAPSGYVPDEQEQGDSSEVTTVPETTNEETSPTSANPGAGAVDTTSTDNAPHDVVDHEPIPTARPVPSTVEPPLMTSSDVPSHKIDPPAASASNTGVSDNDDQDKVQTSELSELHTHKQLMDGHTTTSSPVASEQCEPTSPPDGLTENWKNGLPASAAEPVPAPTLTPPAGATVVAQAATKVFAALPPVDAATVVGERVTSACGGDGCDTHCDDKTEKLPDALRSKTTRAQRRATRTAAAQTRRISEDAAPNAPSSLLKQPCEGIVHDVDKANPSATSPDNISSLPVGADRCLVTGEVQKDTPLQPDDVSATVYHDTLEEYTTYSRDAISGTESAPESVGDPGDEARTVLVDVEHTDPASLTGVLGGAGKDELPTPDGTHCADGLTDKDDQQRLTRLLRRDSLGQVMIFGEKRENVTRHAALHDDQLTRSPQLLSGVAEGLSEPVSVKLPDYTVEDGSSDSDCVGSHHQQVNNSVLTSDQVPLPQPQPLPTMHWPPVKTASGVRPPRKPKPPRTGQHGDHDSGGGSTDREIEAHREDLERRRERAREKSWEVRHCDMLIV
jgi:hypothetical protein